MEVCLFLLTMTHGWQSFSWQLANPSVVVYAHADQNGLLMQCRSQSLQQNQLVSASSTTEAVIYLMLSLYSGAT